MAVTPRDEQEAIISYDKELDVWHLYSNVPTLNRKWQDKLEPESMKITVEDTGQISLLEGTVIGNVQISKKRKLSEAQKEEMAERLRKARVNSKR